MFAVPMSAPAKLEYRGLPLDLMEDLLASSPAWLQAQRVTHAPKAQVSGRPLIPLHRGHVGLLCTSSLLNGRFGQGRDIHLSFWESVKVVDKVEEDGASPGAIVIRERERFSQRLTLLYGDGRFALLSEKANGKRRARMQNAHIRMGTMTFVKQTRDTVTDVTVHLNQLVAGYPPPSGPGAAIHLASVFGGDVEIGAVAADELPGLEKGDAPSPWVREVRYSEQLTLF